MDQLGLAQPVDDLGRVANPVFIRPSIIV